MENIFFLILVAVVGLIRWLSQVAEKKRNAEAEKQSGTPESAVPPARSAPQTEEERVRKFFEALGVPVETAPPPKPQPRQSTPKTAPADRKFMPVDPFPVPRGRVVTPAPPPLPVAPVAATRTAPAAEITVSKKPPIRLPKSMLSSEFEVQDWAADENAQPEIAVGSLVRRLATKQGLRDAIVLREIFGPPRSMQPLESTMLG